MHLVARISMLAQKADPDLRDRERVGCVSSKLWKS